MRDGLAGSEFVAVSANKINLLQYLCDKWSNKPIVEGIALYLSGGFHDVEETIKMTPTDIVPVPALESTHEDGQNLKALYSLGEEEQHLQME